MVKKGCSYAFSIYLIHDWADFLNASMRFALRALQLVVSECLHQQSETWPATVAIADLLFLEHLNPIRSYHYQAVRWCRNNRVKRFPRR